MINIHLFKIIDGIKIELHCDSFFDAGIFIDALGFDRRSLEYDKARSIYDAIQNREDLNHINEIKQADYYLHIDPKNRLDQLIFFLDAYRNETEMSKCDHNQITEIKFKSFEHDVSESICIKCRKVIEQKGFRICC